MRGQNAVVCNGELYGFRPLRTYLEGLGYTFASDSDCEIFLPLYERLGCAMFPLLDAEFALVISDGSTDSLVAARDPIGIRPLYYGYDETDAIWFASEPRSLVGVCGKILPFPPGHYYKDGVFTCYCAPAEPAGPVIDAGLDEICAGIRSRLLKGIEKRLDADYTFQNTHCSEKFNQICGNRNRLQCSASARWYRPLHFQIHPHKLHQY